MDIYMIPSLISFCSAEGTPTQRDLPWLNYLTWDTTLLRPITFYPLSCSIILSTYNLMYYILLILFCNFHLECKFHKGKYFGVLFMTPSLIHVRHSTNIWPLSGLLSFIFVIFLNQLILHSLIKENRVAIFTWIIRD